MNNRTEGGKDGAVLVIFCIIAICFFFCATIVIDLLRIEQVSFDAQRAADTAVLSGAQFLNPPIDAAKWDWSASAPLVVLLANKVRGHVYESAKDGNNQPRGLSTDFADVSAETTSDVVRHLFHGATNIASIRVERGHYFHFTGTTDYSFCPTTDPAASPPVNAIRVTYEVKYYPLVFGPFLGFTNFWPIKRIGVASSRPLELAATACP